MLCTHIKSAEFSPRKWSGGLTTEFYIFPKEASYVERNFQFRLSSATVDLEESVFTPLPDVARTLLVLEGKMKLTHSGHHSTVLHPGDADKFEGGWKTTSAGTCVDFNLMTMGDSSGELFLIGLGEEEQLQLTKYPKNATIFLYLYTGIIEISGAQKFRLSKGDLLSISDLDDTSIKVLAIKKSQIVLCQINRDDTSH